MKHFFAFYWTDGDTHPGFDIVQERSGNLILARNMFCAGKADDENIRVMSPVKGCNYDATKLGLIDATLLAYIPPGAQNHYLIDDLEVLICALLRTSISSHMMTDRTSVRNLVKDIDGFSDLSALCEKLSGGTVSTRDMLDAFTDFCLAAVSDGYHTFLSATASSH